MKLLLSILIFISISCASTVDFSLSEDELEKIFHGLEGPGLSVMTYNTHLFDLAGHLSGTPYQDGGVFEDFIKYIVSWFTDDNVIDNDSVRAMLIADRINQFGNVKPDVLVFEEVWSDAQALILLNALDYPYYYRPYSQNFLAPHSGLILVSKYKIVSEKFTPFKYLVDDDAFVTKGLGEATLLISDTKKLRIFFTHTQNITVHPESRAAQLSNFDQITTAISNWQHANPNTPVMLTGDLNIAPQVSSTTYVKVVGGLKKLGLEDAWLMQSSIWSDSGSGNSTSGQRLDYFFYEPKQFMQTIQSMPSPSDVMSKIFTYLDHNGNEVELSDHYPVLVKFN